MRVDLKKADPAKVSRHGKSLKCPFHRENRPPFVSILSLAKETFFTTFFLSEWMLAEAYDKGNVIGIT